MSIFTHPHNVTHTYAHSQVPLYSLLLILINLLQLIDRETVQNL